MQPSMHCSPAIDSLWSLTPVSVLHRFDICSAQQQLVWIRAQYILINQLVSVRIKMRQCYERVTRSKQAKCSPCIHRVAVDLNDDLDLQCKKCLMVFAPLHSVNYYMKVNKNQAVIGEDFLVLRKMNYFNIKLEKGQVSIFEHEPFQCMSFRDVNCKHCDNFLGYYFQTSNMNGTRWLMSSIAVNMAQVSVMSGQRNLVQVLLRELEKLKPYKSERLELVNEELLAEEGLISKLMKDALDPAYHENKKRAEVVGNIMERLKKFDKNALHLQKRAKLLLSMANVILQRYRQLFPLLKKQAMEKDLIKRQETS